MKKIFKNLWEKAYLCNKRHILSMLDLNPEGNLLDLGCSDGEWTIECAKKMGTHNIYGVEVLDEQILSAQSKGVTIKKGDLNKFIPYKNNFFDVVHANQVIEHLYDTETFLIEINRVLRGGGN